jgi:MATE family multidrug resistance protein
VGESIGARKLEHYRAVLRASTRCALVVAALASLVYLCAGSTLIGLFTNVESVRMVARRFLPWIVALPVVSVWAFQLDGIFIGATHARELRDSMLISFIVFLGLAVALQRPLGNHGLWCAFSIWMAVRGITLAMRLPRIERMFAEHEPVTN